MPDADNRGLVEVYTGNGKGKTTAAMGVALRAIGSDKKVYIIYFMKGSQSYGEQIALSKLPNCTFSRFGLDSFVDPENVTNDDKEEAQKAFLKAQEVIYSNNYDLVILDEINIAVAWKLLDVNDVIRMISMKPEKVELILTGRYADSRLINLADLVTEMVEIKHPYTKGIQARQGIDY